MWKRCLRDKSLYHDAILVFPTGIIHMLITVGHILTSFPWLSSQLRPIGGGDSTRLLLKTILPVNSDEKLKSKK